MGLQIYAVVFQNTPSQVFMHSHQLFLSTHFNFGKPLRKFAFQLFALLKQKWSVRIFTYCTLQKTGSYFNLKFKTASALNSNVIYESICLRDVNTTYIRMSAYTSSGHKTSNRLLEQKLL